MPSLLIGVDSTPPPGIQGVSPNIELRETMHWKYLGNANYIFHVTQASCVSSLP